MRRADFDWRAVMRVWGRADLDYDLLPDGRRVRSDQPHYPSQRYRTAYRWMDRRLISPPREEAPTRAETVRKMARLMHVELANADPPDPVTAERWEQAEEALQEAAELAEATQHSARPFS